MGKPLRIGLQVNSTQRIFRWPELRDLVRAVEDAGLDSVWTEDHLFYGSSPVGPWDAWAMLSAIAAVTERIRLGSFVTPLPLRHPALLAKQAEAVDEVSDGRLVLGIGVGHVKAEFEGIGSSLDHRVGRFEDALRIIVELFARGESTYSGPYFRTDGFHLVPRGPRPRPELMVGSSGPRTLRAALPHVDGWNWDGFESNLEEYAEASRLVDLICREIGREPDSIWRSAHVVARLDGAQGMPFDPLPEGFRLISGDAEEIAVSLRDWADAGADELQILVDPLTPRSVETLARASELASA